MSGHKINIAPVTPAFLGSARACLELEGGSWS